MMVGRKKLVLVQGYLRGKSKIKLTSKLVWDKHVSFFCASVGDEDKKKEFCGTDTCSSLTVSAASDSSELSFCSTILKLANWVLCFEINWRQRYKNCFLR